jgi:hypothetical protein
MFLVHGTRGVCADGPATLIVTPPVNNRRPLVSVTGASVRPTLAKKTTADAART